jgi:hypothetical protein
MRWLDVRKTSAELRLERWAVRFAAIHDRV